jgi:hypothetical protein
MATMMNKRPKMPDEGLGKFCIIAGGVLIILPLFMSWVHVGQRLSVGTGGFIGLSWGLQQVAAVKKWKQKYGEPTPEEQMEIKKSHSISDLPMLLTWLVLVILALILLANLTFLLIAHYQGVQLIRHQK